MPKRFLSELAHRPLPYTVKGQRELELIKALRKAGYILALTFDLNKRDGYARVLSVTPAGRAALARTMAPSYQHGGGIDREPLSNITRMLSTMTDNLSFSSEDIAKVLAWTPTDVMELLPMVVRSQPDICG